MANLDGKEKDVDIDELCAYVVNDLKELRESKGISTSKLSELTNIAQANITRMEVGNGGIPNLRTIVTIASALGAKVKIVVSK